MWIILIVAVVLVVLPALMRRAPRSGAPRAARFIPDPRNDKVIVIEGWNAAELETIMRDFMSTYSDFRSFQVEEMSTDPPRMRMTFPQDVDPALFFLLINYLVYPKGMSLRGRTIAVLGATTLTAAFPLPDAKLLGSRAKVYVPSDDHKYDVVYVYVPSAATYEASLSAFSKWRNAEHDRVSERVRKLMSAL